MMLWPFDARVYALDRAEIRVRAKSQTCAWPDYAALRVFWTIRRPTH